MRQNSSENVGPVGIRREVDRSILVVAITSSRIRARAFFDAFGYAVLIVFVT
ncbi:MAG: hypothetical protein QM630_05810 [Microbacterium sp.]